MGEQEALQLVEIGRGKGLVAPQALHSEVIIMGTEEIMNTISELLELVIGEKRSYIHLAWLREGLDNLAHGASGGVRLMAPSSWGFASWWFSRASLVLLYI